MNHPNAVRKTVILELLAVGGGLSGRAYCEQGSHREFSGRIGLMRAIDDLLDARSNEERLPGGDPPDAVRQRPDREGGRP